MSANAPTVPVPTDKQNPQQAQLMEQYKTYLQTVNYSAESRLQTSQFFMIINGFLGTFVGYMLISPRESVGKWTALSLFCIAAVGFFISRIWYLLLTHYTTINSVKWEMIYDIEKDFPDDKLKLFTSEWNDKLSPKRTDTPGCFAWLWEPRRKPKGKKKEHPFYSYSDIVNELPRLFGGMYIVLGLFTGIYWLCSNRNNIILFWENIRRLGLELAVEWAGFVALIVLVLVIASRSPNKR